VADQIASLQAALIGRYTIERDVGRGGMATVYLADDLKHHRRVAIKVLRPDLAAALGTERFLREIDTVAQLNHPHILPLHDSGESGGFVYFVMPFIDGASLRLRLEGGRRLGVDQALAIAAPVADALSYAHRMGVLHRDVKPENILFSQGHPIVADFGIAKAISTVGRANLTRTGLAIGTPGYMSPEQAVGLTELDERSDVYSLAIVVYEMLVGEVPGSWPMEDLVRPGRFLKMPPSHRSCLTEAGSCIEGALVHALAIRHEERTPTPEAFMAELTAAGPGQRYGEGEVQERVKRAEDEAARRALDGVSAVGEEESLASAAGIDPTAERPAVGSQEESAAAPGTTPRPSLWLGGPTILLFERLVEGEIADAGYHVMVEEIRGAFDAPGQVSQLGRSVSWAVSFAGPPWRDLGVAVAVRGGYTRITIRENLLQLLIPIVGFGLASVAVGLNPIVAIVRSAVDLSWMGDWAAPLAWVVTIATAARTSYQYIGKRRARQLSGVADRLATLARKLVLERSALPLARRFPE
jgi:tRNA A-37 threonylcarbamoyl transferase component Bud32